MRADRRESATSVSKLRQLEERKQTILRSIESQHALTDELRQQIERADSVKRLEDLYLPFRPKKQTLATKAREQGLGPLAEEILTQGKAVRRSRCAGRRFRQHQTKACPMRPPRCWAPATSWPSSSARTPSCGSKVRKMYRKTGKLVSAKVEDDAKKNQQFHDYLDFREPLQRIPPHRVLAINRGERAKILRVKIESDEAGHASSWRSSCSCRPSMRIRISSRAA